MRQDLPPAPLIVTAELDPGAQTLLEELRRRHFPPERSLIPAHLTLFHHLPGEEREAVVASLREAAAAAGGPLDAVLDRVLRLGRGVAYGVHSPGLVELRSGLARRWGDRLTTQDARWRRPHVTVQNKVEPAVAAALHAELSAAFEPRPAQVRALLLWRYLGGPWELLARVPL